MADTIREKIMKDLECTLKEIKKSAGFDNDLKKVFRVGDPDSSFSEMPVILLKEGDETDKNDANDITACDMEVMLMIYVRVDAITKMAPGKQYNSILGDIKKKLPADLGRNGNAVDTKFTHISGFDLVKGNSEYGLIVTVAIDYRHQNNDPKIAR